MKIVGHVQSDSLHFFILNRNTEVSSDFLSALYFEKASTLGKHWSKQKSRAIAKLGRKPHASTASQPKILLKSCPTPGKSFDLECQTNSVAPALLWLCSIDDKAFVNERWDDRTTLYVEQCATSIFSCAHLAEITDRDCLFWLAGGGLSGFIPLASNAS